jgi:hypothetical protein
MRTGASSDTAARPKHAAGIFPVCLTAVALAALSPTFSMLARATLVVASLSAVNLPSKSLGVEYTDEQIDAGVGACTAPESDLSK